MSKETVTVQTQCYGSVECKVEQSEKHGEIFRPLKEMKKSPKVSYGKK